MIKSSVADGHCWRPHGKASNVELSSTAIPKLGSFVHELRTIVKSCTSMMKYGAYLVKGGEYVIGELDLCDGCLAH